MKKFLLISTIVLSITTAHAQTISLTSGGSGTTTGVPQSFNETRGVDVTVLSSSLSITAVTLHRFCTGTSIDSGFVGLRIYDSGTQALLYAHDTTVHPMYDGTVTIPQSFILNSGQSYRISFYCFGYGNNHNSGSAFEYQPTFPYNESNNLLLINHSHAISFDMFPANPNIYVPFIELTYTVLSSVHEFENNTALNIFPNPFTEQTTLQADKNLIDATVTVYNTVGQQVIQIKNISGPSVTLHRNNLPCGLYFIRLMQDNKIVSAYKLVITDLR